MHKTWMTANSIAWICVLVLFMSSSVAVGADVVPTGVPPQDDVLSLDGMSASMDSEFSYQGVLKSNGAPVNGYRNFVFQIHNNYTCTSQLQEIIKSAVPVVDGRFSVSLMVKHQYFNGQKLYLQVVMGTARLMCEEILAVPYALSIAPDAEINTQTADVTINTFDAAKNISKGVVATARGGTSNFGLVGVVDDTSGAGVYAVSNTAGGDGIYARNPHGGLAGHFVGDVAQNTEAFGLVKAAAKASCSNTSPQVYDQFGPETITITSSGTGRCTLNFGFDLDDRFWSATVAGTTGNFVVSCFLPVDTTTLSCSRVDMSNVYTNGHIIVIIY